MKPLSLPFLKRHRIMSLLSALVVLLLLSQASPGSAQALMVIPKCVPLARTLVPLTNTILARGGLLSQGGSIISQLPPTLGLTPSELSCLAVIHQLAPFGDSDLTVTLLLGFRPEIIQELEDALELRRTRERVDFVTGAAPEKKVFETLQKRAWRSKVPPEDAPLFERIIRILKEILKEQHPHDLPHNRMNEFRRIVADSISYAGFCSLETVVRETLAHDRQLLIVAASTPDSKEVHAELKHIPEHDCLARAIFLEREMARCFIVLKTIEGTGVDSLAASPDVDRRKKAVGEVLATDLAGGGTKA